MYGGTKRCSIHGIDYPAHVTKCQVPECNEELAYFNDPFDEEWRDKVEYWTKRELADDLWETYDPLTTPDCSVTPAEYAGKLWVAHEALLKAGYLFLEDFRVVQIQGKFYELQAHIGRASLTHGIKGGVWWIEEIDPDAIEIPDYAPKGGVTNGEEADEQRGCAEGSEVPQDGAD